MTDAAGVKQACTETGYLVDQRMAPTLGIHELASHNPRLWLVIHEPHDLDGQFHHDSILRDARCRELVLSTS